MIYLSAQPDDYYFTWQLELQIYNFNTLNIAPKDIHILIGYDSKRGLRSYFKNLIERLDNKASFFIYPDLRKEKNYPPSIRPHIIQQHLERFPALQEKAIFYHDSDVIFRILPNFRCMLEDDSWYVSDTRNYLNSNYIRESTNNAFFKKMCTTIGITPKKVIENDDNAGGAQYLLKNTPIDFWRKIENHSEALYNLMENFNNKNKALSIKGNRHPTSSGIQSWCADMWALLWGSLLLGKKVRIHQELRFCWPANPIKEWKKTKILHYSGVTPENASNNFCKSLYTQHTPFNVNFKNIGNNCSLPLIKQIQKYDHILKKNRANLRDTSFLISFQINSKNNLNNLYIIVKFLTKYFDTNILIAEFGSQRQVDPNLLPDNTNYFFIFENIEEYTYVTKINNFLIKRATTNIIILYNMPVILPIEQIIKSIILIRQNKADLLSPSNGTCLYIDNIFNQIFMKVLDSDLFVFNKGKYNVITHHFCGGVAFINRGKFVQAGMDNEFITDSYNIGTKGLERMKRMEILNYIVKSIDSLIFMLPNEKVEFEEKEDNIRSDIEYKKICNMDYMALNKYISTWEWTNNSFNKDR